MDYILIDRQKLKALLSESRITILKHLAKRRYTITELAEMLNTTKSNVADHLDKLEETQLVEQIDEGRKWKYYTLTTEGRRVIEGGSIAKPIAILLVSAFLMTIVAFNILTTISESARLAALQQVDSEFSFIPKFDMIVMVTAEMVLAIILIWSILEFVKCRGRI
ncbi:winged helix-turn-helix transcriptional regulator [Candidatus Micrarchaeota archaeon]|nr:winged helix-turn-helix transcriptional regulator [Candidatus Micrarchaeota archaeon]